MARPEKIAQVEKITALINEAQSVVLSDFTGLDVEKISQLRNACREAGVKFRVVKNTLAKRGVAGTDAESLSEYLEGPTALVISPDSDNQSAKVLEDFAKEHDGLPVFKAGFVDGKVISAAEVMVLAKLPSKEELLSKIMAGLQSPASGLVSVLQGPARGLVGVLKQISEKSE